MNITAIIIFEIESESRPTLSDYIIKPGDHTETG